MKGDSVRNLSMRAEERHLRHQQFEYTILLKVEGDDDENDAHFQDQLNSARTTEMEGELPAHDHNVKYSERYFALRREQQRLRFQQRGVHMMPIIMEEDEQDAHPREEVDPVKINL
jgi:hypothetical protein